MPNSTTAGSVMLPVAAAQPITGGSAPGTAPTSVDRRCSRLERRVEQHVADQGDCGHPGGRDVHGVARAPTSPTPENTIPKEAPSATRSRPPGSGRLLVRLINRSVLRSHT